MIKDQQAKNPNTTKYNPRSDKVLDYWNGNEDNEGYLSDHGISLMTYDRLVSILLDGCDEEYESLKNVKIVIFDECHTLFSDTFIHNIDLVIQWTLDKIYAGDRYIIGLTATPTIVEYNAKRLGGRINRMNKNMIIQYQAKQMICTDFDTIPYLVSSNKLKGKTLILCASIADCMKLQESLKNAAVIVSPNAPEYTASMQYLRDYIVDYESLPEYFDYPVGEGIFEKRKLEVLITTSTMREGVNLREESGIRNVISCFTDELHVTQFAGRCRYNLDTIVIANTYVRSDNLRPDEYLQSSRLLFKKYWENKKNIAWFNTVSHLVTHDCYGVHRFVLGSDDVRFIEFINKYWLVPKGVGVEEAKAYCIHTSEQKEGIRTMAINCNLFPLLYARSVTFSRVIGLLEDSLGYTIESGRTIFKDDTTGITSRDTYKLIINFDDDKLDKERNYIAV